MCATVSCHAEFEANKKAVRNLKFFIRRTYETSARFGGTDLQNAQESVECPSIHCAYSELEPHKNEMLQRFCFFLSHWSPLSLDSKTICPPSFSSSWSWSVSPSVTSAAYLYSRIVFPCVAFLPIHASSSCFVHFAWPSFCLSYPVIQLPNTIFFLSFSQILVFLSIFYVFLIFFTGPFFIQFLHTAEHDVTSILSPISGIIAPFLSLFLRLLFTHSFVADSGISNPRQMETHQNIYRPNGKKGLLPLPQTYYRIKRFIIFFSLKNCYKKMCFSL